MEDATSGRPRAIADETSALAENRCVRALRQTELAVAPEVMDPDFWHERWRRGEIGWHARTVNAHLRRFWPELGVPSAARVLVPLCGKSLDLLWLAERGHPVVGVEISAVAVAGLFTEHGLTPTVDEWPPFRRYRAAGLTVLHGDFFALTPAVLGPVVAVFDRAALVALPPALRARYAAHLIQLAGAAPSLLLTYEYDQTRMPGPPFAVSGAELVRHYGARYHLIELARCDALAEQPALRQRGIDRLTERVWRLEPRPS